MKIELTEKKNRVSSIKKKNEIFLILFFNNWRWIIQ